MKRRVFLKASAAGLASAFLPLGGKKGAAAPPSAKDRTGSGPEEIVFLSGTARGASEKVLQNAVRKAAEAVTDFSWLSKGDTVFI